MGFGLDIPARLADLSIRCLLLAAAAIWVIGWLRVRTAAARHAVWTVVTAAMLLLPALNLLFPSMPLRVLHPPPTVQLAPSAPVAHVSAVPVTASGLPSPSANPRPFTWRQIVAAVYTAG